MFMHITCAYVYIYTHTIRSGDIYSIGMIRSDNTLNACSDIIELVLTKIMMYSRNIVMLDDIDSVLAVRIYDYVIVTH